MSALPSLVAAVFQCMHYVIAAYPLWEEKP